jgi:hypothetical protein
MVRRGARPISEVAGSVRSCLAEGDEATAWRWLVQFADDFRGSGEGAKASLVSTEAPSTGDRRYDAAIGALVEHLCAENGVPAPAWTDAPFRSAEPWWFPAGLRDLRPSMLRDSPISFKRHGVFVSAKAFRRV